MHNVIVYLIGPPGVGKYSAGKVLAERMPAKLLDNHYWCNPIFEIVEPDGRNPLPPAVWDRANDVFAAVLETVATLGPPDRNYVFTHAVGDDGGDPEDFAIARRILGVAARRKARALVVRLSCNGAALAGRIASEGRAERLKMTDASQAERLAALAPMALTHDWTFDLDTTDLTPQSVADAVMAEIAGARPADGRRRRPGNP
jgi:broad-specificity NMP kinase